jgi:hypothetical protein
VDWSRIRICETNKILIGELVRNFDDNVSTFYVLSSGNVQFNKYAYKLDESKNSVRPTSWDQLLLHCYLSSGDIKSQMFSLQ